MVARAFKTHEIYEVRNKHLPFNYRVVVYPFESRYYGILDSRAKIDDFRRYIIGNNIVEHSPDRAIRISDVFEGQFSEIIGWAYMIRQVDLFARVLIFPEEMIINGPDGNYLEAKSSESLKAERLARGAFDLLQAVLSRKDHILSELVMDFGIMDDGDGPPRLVWIGEGINPETALIRDKDGKRLFNAKGMAQIVLHPQELSRCCGE